MKSFDTFQPVSNVYIEDLENMYKEAARVLKKVTVNGRIYESLIYTCNDADIVRTNLMRNYQ